MSDPIDTSRRRRSIFTLRELLALVAVISILCALLLPAIQAAREDARRSACVAHLKELDLALLNYAYTRHHFPPISTNSDPTSDVPGDATSTTGKDHTEPGTRPSPGAGYSWIVNILPEIEEGPLYQTISTNSIVSYPPQLQKPAYSSSGKFAKAAFDPTIVNAPLGVAAPHVATVQLQALRCPSFSGGDFVDQSMRTQGAARGPSETGTVPPNYAAGIATANGADGIAITNYNAVLGTHIDITASKGYPAYSASLESSNNGGMKFRGYSYMSGASDRSPSDGLSKFPLIAETRERRFSSWYDGTMNWVVAARHSKPSAGTRAITPASNTLTGKINGHPVDGRWVVGTDGTTATGGTALNYGPTKANPTAVYLPTAALADPDISGIGPGRLWGPSSEHSSGAVYHAFADGHVNGITDQIDPNVYLWLVTRNGGEPIENAP